MSVKPLNYQLIALNGTERNKSKKHPIEEKEHHLGWKQHSCGTSIPWHVGDKPYEPDTYLPSRTKASQSNKALGQGKTRKKKGSQRQSFQVNIDYLPTLQGQEEEKSTKQKQLKQQLTVSDRGGEARGKEQTLRLITDTWTCLGTDWFPGPSKAICLLGSGCRPFALGYLLSPRSWDLL
ncbi:hypothetical protein L1987_08599 [Smallanthus sonchifolius]|uniref:Uncharacterized protein n=1 Tax=Smallanthus sonchifolius TaxID=185202 RepID=A0ACB9JN14_9ASTR|nr:hypothetical protein L1987_08599 [Smallanthus sonchifolius]